MSKRRVSGAAAGFVFMLIVATGGGLQPPTAPHVLDASSAGTHAAGWSFVQVGTDSQEVFWDRLCRMLKLCG